MGKIVYFIESLDVPCAVRFVKGYRKGGWFRRERVEYTFSLNEAMEFPLDSPLIERVTSVIRRNFLHAKIKSLGIGEFEEAASLRKFWAIVVCDEVSEKFYCGRFDGGRPVCSDDIMECSMMLSKSFADEVLRTVQVSRNTRAFVTTLYLPFVNGLLSPCMMITCTAKRSGVTKFLARVEGNRLRLVNTSGSAHLFTYEDALVTFNHLSANNKSFLYAILPAFEKNVNARDLEKYVAENNVSRALAMDFQLKNVKSPR